MPVSIKPTKKVGSNSDPIAASSQEFLEGVAPSWKDKTILHSSFNDFDGDTRPKVIAYGNGFTNGVIRAYQQDLNLVLRPDDVWLAIITQFGFYVTGHAEELRSKFVAHEGQKKLVLKVEGSFLNLDVGDMARRFTCLIEGHLVDKDVRGWLIPDFSTTTDNDMAVSALTMMATMKHYFSYEGISDCGFPSVTLLGEKEDWENIRRRLDRFPLYGEEPETWSKLLIPILDRFIATFNDPDNVHTKIFWEEVCYAEGEIDSGSTDTFSGWITAFAFWDSTGERNISDDCYRDEKQQYELDEQVYPIIDQSSVTTGVMEVPLVFKAHELGIEFQTTLVAGSVGVTVTEGTEAKPGESLQPRSGWWMFENSRKPIEI